MYYKTKVATATKCCSQNAAQESPQTHFARGHVIGSLAIAASILRHCRENEEEHPACDVSAHSAAGRPHVGAAHDIIDATLRGGRSRRSAHLGLRRCARSIRARAVPTCCLAADRSGAPTGSTRGGATLL